MCKDLYMPAQLYQSHLKRLLIIMWPKTLDPGSDGAWHAGATAAYFRKLLCLEFRQ